MQSSLIACILLATLAPLAGCVEEEEMDAQTPVAVRAREFSYGRSDPADQPSTVYVVERPQAVQRLEQAPMYPLEGYATPPPRKAISFGYIGDEPVGRFDNGGSHSGPWWRPFNPESTRTYYGPSDSEGCPYFYPGRRRR